MRTQFVAAGGWLAITLTIAATTAAGQSSKLPNPADPRTESPAAKHESAFSDYQPFREQKIRSWKEANQEVADNPGMGSMGSMGSMKGTPGMDSKTGNAPNSNPGAASQDIAAMKDMPGMDSKAADAPKGKQGAAGHDMAAMGSMKDMPGKSMQGMDSKAGDAPMSNEGNGAMAMAKPQTATGQPEKPPTTSVTGIAVVQGVDKANGKVKLTHEPIAALGWPKMTMFFRLKDSALADQVKEGDKVEFSLEKSASGYVISEFKKGRTNQETKSMK